MTLEGKIDQQYTNESNPPITLNINFGLERLNIFGVNDSNDHKETNKSKRYEPSPIEDNKISEITAPRGPPKFITIGSLV